MATDNKTAQPAVTNIDRARAAAQKYQSVKLNGVFLKMIRKAGGSAVFLFTVEGDDAQIAAFKEVQAQVKVPKSASNPTGSGLIIDQISGKPLFFLPTVSSTDVITKGITITWSSGNPDVNPLGRFIFEDTMNVVLNEIKLGDMILAERAKLISSRGLGRTGALNEPRGNSNQTSVLSDETLLDRMRDEDANP